MIFPFKPLFMEDFQVPWLDTGVFNYSVYPAMVETSQWSGLQVGDEMRKYTAQPTSGSFTSTKWSSISCPVGPW